MPTKKRLMSPREKPAKEPAEALPRPYEIVQPPPWIRPKPHHETVMSIFYARPGAVTIVQALFMIDRTGVVFFDRCTHTPLERVDMRKDATIALPACVLEVLAVESRKKEQGR